MSAWVVFHVDITKQNLAMVWEIAVEELKKYPNIVVKYGRYIPNSESHYDEVLGITLASSNQYAEKIS